MLTLLMCLQFPHLYQQGIKNLHFGWSQILGWMANGVASSLVVFFFTINILKRQAFRKGGQVPSLDILGATLYSCVVWTVNCQLALVTKYFTWIQHVCIWGSILLWYLFLVVYGYIPPAISTTAYHVFVEACAPAPSYWLTVLLVTGAALIPSFVFTSFQNKFCPTDDQIIQEFSYLEKHKDQTWLQRAMRNKTYRVPIGLTARRKHQQRGKKGRQKRANPYADMSGKISPIRSNNLDS